MRFAEVTKEASQHLNELSERYQVPQRLRVAGDTVRVAGDTARRGAEHAYRYALEHPRTSVAAGVILAAAVVGGVLWYLFGGPGEPVERRRRNPRVRAKSERRTKRAAAARA